jgi:hypothetical protein
VHNDTTETIPVYAPVGGKILGIHTFSYGSGYDHRLTIGVKKHYSYYLIHLVASSGLHRGTTIQAGQQVGVASNKAAAVDLGALNENSPQSFIDPNHYPDISVYSDAPLKYYTEPLKTQLYAAVRRLGADKDGRFCYDQAGKLIGGWFLAGVTRQDILAGTAVGTKEIAFVYDNYDPNQIMISVGGTVLTKGVYYVQNSASDPASVGTSSGKVTYKLYSASQEAGRVGLLIVKMNATAAISVEATNNVTSETMDFTSAASSYIR